MMDVFWQTVPGIWTSVGETSRFRVTIPMDGIPMDVIPTDAKIFDFNPNPNPNPNPKPLP